MADNDELPDYSQDPGKGATIEVEAEAEAEPTEESVQDTDAAEVVESEEEENIVDKIAAFRAKAMEEKSRLTETHELDAYKTKLSRFEELERLKRDDPLKFIKESGLKFEDITKSYLKKV